MTKANQTSVTMVPPCQTDNYPNLVPPNRSKSKTSQIKYLANFLRLQYFNAHFRTYIIWRQNWCQTTAKLKLYITSETILYEHGEQGSPCPNSPHFERVPLPHSDECERTINPHSVIPTVHFRTTNFEYATTGKLYPWLTVMAKESSKSTEEAITEIDHNLAIMQKENCHNLAGISKIDHTLAMTYGDKPSAPSGKGYIPAAIVETVEPLGECGNTRLKITQITKPKHCT